jgi:hypothetical protein
VNTADKIIHHEEMVYWSIPNYDLKNNHALKSTTDNSAAFDAEANFYLDAYQAEVQVITPGDATYAGLLPIPLDGAIRQVTWSTGPGGATTRASRNTEWNLAIPSYRELTMLNQMRQQLPVIQKLQDQQRRR